jgi:hypothetical protein
MTETSPLNYEEEREIKKERERKKEREEERKKKERQREKESKKERERKRNRKKVMREGGNIYKVKEMGTFFRFLRFPVSAPASF